MDSPPTAALIIGAGASLEVANLRSPLKTEHPDWSPPLAAHLFQFRDRSHYFEVAKPWPGAIALTQDLAGSNKENISLEDELLRLATHQSEHVRQQFKHIPPYLRNLLSACEQNHVHLPLTYTRLFHELLDETDHRLAIVCLNYDTFLEQALVPRGPSRKRWFTHINEYIHGPEPRVRLCKPHGSTNWFVSLGRSRAPDQSWHEALAETDVLRRTSEPQVLGHWSNATSGAFTHDGYHYYPCLTAPLADKDEDQVVCPRPHVNLVSEWLRECKKTLIAGCSGRDDNVLAILRNALPEQEVTWVVTESPDSARQVTARFREAVPQMVNFAAATDGFRNFVFGPPLRKFAQA